MAAARAAERVTEAAIAELEATHRALLDAKRNGNFGLALRYNEAFHLGLARESGLPRLLRIVESLWTQSGPFLNFLFNGPECWATDNTLHIHTKVLEALSRRDADAARAAIVEDISRGGAVLEARLP